MTQIFIILNLIKRHHRANLLHGQLIMDYILRENWLLSATLCCSLARGGISGPTPSSILTFSMAWTSSQVFCMMLQLLWVLICSCLAVSFSPLLLVAYSSLSRTWIPYNFCLPCYIYYWNCHVSSLVSHQFLGDSLTAEFLLLCLLSSSCTPFALLSEL